MKETFLEKKVREYEKFYMFVFTLHTCLLTLPSLAVQLQWLKLFFRPS